MENSLVVIFDEISYCNYYVIESKNQKITKYN